LQRCYHPGMIGRPQTGPRFVGQLVAHDARRP
jgi:hypothetical protein